MGFPPSSEEGQASAGAHIYWYDSHHIHLFHKDDLFI